MEPWYKRSFQEDYLLVYRHRDDSGAKKEVEAMANWLKLPPGAKVLDLCCGAGRHSFVLDGMGLSVTGVDLSEALLSEARSKDVDSRIRWCKGDMRQVPLHGPFDALFNLFTSFGYFESEEENQSVLNEMARLLAENGRFVIDFLNPAYVKQNLIPHSLRRAGDIAIEEHREVKGSSVVKTIRIGEPGSVSRTYQEKVKLYELSDFKRMLERSGLSLDQVFGTYDGMPYQCETSPRMIMAGTKRNK